MPASALGDWACPACGFLNISTLTRCDACDAATSAQRSLRPEPARQTQQTEPAHDVQLLLREVADSIQTTCDAVTALTRKRKLGDDAPHEPIPPALRPSRGEPDTGPVLTPAEASSVQPHSTTPVTGEQQRTVVEGAPTTTAEDDGSRRVLQLPSSSVEVLHQDDRQTGDAAMQPVSAPPPARTGNDSTVQQPKQPRAVVRSALVEQQVDTPAGSVQLEGPGAHGVPWLRLTYDPKKQVLRHQASGEQTKVCGKVGPSEWDALRRCETLGEWHAQSAAVVKRAKAERRMWLIP